ncbi:type II toxin-antitoxin system HicA family toxin [uncultured Corynebacterium sp.]|uniref:type II toxin-antitoxin system HicA family toxin n=1 Tax=uncultured Corynebacterium sp. TaxID=159447 RepID=UPI0025D0A947|nr:type II toxin-antitoxin system HicA family toxin [uncultured Corynebacterium sp.]
MTKPLKYRDLVQRLHAAGFSRARQGIGDHEVWTAPGLNRPVIITRTREVPPAVTRNTLKAIDTVTKG